MVTRADLAQGLWILLAVAACAGPLLLILEAGTR